MDLGEARNTVVGGALNESPGGRDWGNVDRAIRYVGNDFVEATHCTQTTVDVSLSSGTHVIDLTQTTGMGRFQPTHWLWATINSYPVKWAPLHSVERKYQSSTPMGRPEWIAFEGPDRQVLYPQPDATYTMRVFWWEPFTSFTVNTNSPDTVTLNIPEVYIDKVLWFGAAAAFAYQDPDALFASQGWQTYQQHRAEVAEAFRFPAMMNAAGSAQKPRQQGG